MGEIVKFPACREITPEVYELIKQRTNKSAYWVRRWSVISKRLNEAEPENRDTQVIEDASQYVTDWLYEHNLIALKARGF